MKKTYLKKFKLLNKRWSYSRFKCTDNSQLNSYFSSIKKTNSYQMKKYMAKSAKLPEKPFKSIIKQSIHIPQMTKIALKTYNKLQPHTAVEKYFIQMDPFTVATELPVRSKEYKVGGFIDILRYKDGVCEILDFKIGSDVDGVEHQLYKYKLALSEIFDGKIKVGYFTDNNYVRVNYE